MRRGRKAAVLLAAVLLMVCGGAGRAEWPIDSVVTRGEEEALRELFIIGYARQND